MKTRRGREVREEKGVRNEGYRERTERTEGAERIEGKEKR